MPPKTLSGARCKVFMLDRNTGETFLVGIWNSFSYSVSHDVQASFILGRFSAAELSTTGVEPVNITAQGWRVVNAGPFAKARLTNVKDLLTQEYLKLFVIDRQTGLEVATIEYCLPTGTSSTVSSKQLQESTNTYLGLLLEDESTENSEAASAADLP